MKEALRGPVKKENRDGAGRHSPFSHNQLNFGKKGKDMNWQLRTRVVAAALVIGLAASPLAYAHGSGGSQGSMMGQGMMGQGGMMKMMGQMGQMMETCNKMMQGKMEGHHPQSPGGMPPADDPAKDKEG